MSDHFRSLLRRGYLAELLIAVLALQALVPAGYMPGVAADGSTSLVLCSSANPVGAQLPRGNRSSPDGGDAGDHAERGMCPFAGLAHAAPLVAIAALLQPAWAQFAIVRFISSAVVVAPMPHSRLPGGPPARA